MIKFMNKECLSSKEASTRYGYSVFWFDQMRRGQNGPPFYQRKKKSKVFYPVEECDEWFKKKMMEKE